MTTPPTPSRTRTALLAGATTTLYYAIPDIVRSPATRRWLRAGLTAASIAGSLPELRAARAAARARHEEDGAPADQDTVATHRKVVGATVAVAMLASTAGSVIAAERWIFRRGEARGAAGKYLPHTRAALVLGTLAAALAMTPSPAIGNTGGLSNG